MPRLGLAGMLAAGPRAVSRYTGTLLAVFVAQSLVSVMCMFGVALVLTRAFARWPMFDEAVDGDLVALIYSVRHGGASLAAAGCLVLGAILLWQLATWFLVGGLNGVLAQRPEGRGDTARCFGASGATTYLSYCVIALCSLLGWLVAAVLLVLGVAFGYDRLTHALTVTELLGPLALATLPAALVLHFTWTVTDYARVELTLRYDSHHPGPLMTYLRTVGYVLRRPVTLAHGALGWLIFLAVSAAYAYLAHGRPMYGAEGAAALFVARQCVALVRMAARVGVLAGQVELGRTRPLPPRHVEALAESKP